MVLAQAFSFMILLLCTFFEASQGAGFDRCGTDYRCDLTGANLEGNNIFLPNGQEFFQTLNSSEDECACRCKTWGQECKAWTLDKGSNKCYLKTRSSQPQFGPPFANYISGQKECKCVTDANNCIESGLRYDTAPGGPDVLDKIFITSAIGCSCACHRLRNCLVWTFNKNVVENGKSECTLMARATTRVEEAGFDSAVVNCDYVSTPRFCASGWTEFKGACYFLQPKKDWDSANAACQLQQPKTFNAQLTSILNDEENEFLLNMAGSSEFWIGANRQPRTLNLPKEKWFWQWTDGSNWEYTKWFPDLPDGFGGRQFCGTANWSNTKQWDDGNCEVKRISICKYRLDQ